MADVVRDLVIHESALTSTRTHCSKACEHLVTGLPLLDPDRCALFGAKLRKDRKTRRFRRCADCRRAERDAREIGS